MRVFAFGFFDQVFRKYSNFQSVITFLRDILETRGLDWQLYKTAENTKRVIFVNDSIEHRD